MNNENKIFHNFIRMQSGSICLLKNWDTFICYDFWKDLIIRICNKELISKIRLFKIVYTPFWILIIQYVIRIFYETYQWYILRDNIRSFRNIKKIR